MFLSWTCYKRAGLVVMVVGSNSKTEQCTQRILTTQQREEAAAAATAIHFQRHTHSNSACFAGMHA